MLQVAYAAFFPVQIGRRIGGVLRAELQVMLFGRRDPCADFRFDGHVGTSQVVQSDRFGERRAVHSSDRRVDQSPPVQFAQDGENASGPVDVLYVVMRVGRYLADDGDAARQAVDVAHREVHARLLSDGQQVQHRVRRAAHGDVHRHGVQKGRPRGDRARQHRVVVVEIVFPRVFHDQLGRLAEQLRARLVRRQDRAVARQRQPERFGQAVHRVGREHTRARPAGRAGRMLQRVELLVRIARVGSLDHHVDQVVAALAHASRLHRPARDENGRYVQPHGGHQHARRDLVAVRYADHRVHLVRVAHVLDAVGDQVARRQRVEHAVVTHGDAVVDGDRVEFGGEAAFAFDPLLDLLPDLVKVHMPGHELRKRVDDGNHRLAYLLVFHSVRSP